MNSFDTQPERIWNSSTVYGKEAADSILITVGGQSTLSTRGFGIFTAEGIDMDMELHSTRTVQMTVTITISHQI
jgi:hypothetical protein